MTNQYEQYQDLVTVSIYPGPELAAELRESRLKWYSCIIEASDIEQAMDVYGYSHSRQYGGPQGTARKLYFKAVNERGAMKSLKKAGVNPRFGEVSAVEQGKAPTGGS